jgi:hypothetical protein
VGDPNLSNKASQSSDRPAASIGTDTTAVVGARRVAAAPRVAALVGRGDMGFAFAAGDAKGAVAQLSGAGVGEGGGDIELTVGGGDRGGGEAPARGWASGWGGSARGRTR